MSLLDLFSVDCVLLTRIRVDDPVGGYKRKWADGATFSAAWEFESAPEVTVAEQQGVKRTYNIYVDKTLKLEYHEAFRRTDTGDTYRVTNPGDDRKTPAISRLNRQLVVVEKWEIPNDDDEQEEDDV